MTEPQERLGWLTLTRHHEAAAALVVQACHAAVEANPTADTARAYWFALAAHYDLWCQRLGESGTSAAEVVGQDELDEFNRLLNAGLSGRVSAGGH